MTLKRAIGLLLACSFPLMGSGPVQQCMKVRVPGIRSIFAIAPSPVAGNVLFYGSPQEPEGELLTGKLFRLQLRGASPTTVPVTGHESSNPPTPVWQPDGNSAYFNTDDGIYRLDSAGKAPALLWSGLSQGLAISDNGVLLAFWHVENGTDTLVLYNLSKNSVERRWRIPDRFESDKSGWDLAFSRDSNHLYARTFDESSRTPLKRFDISNGKTTVVASNAYAVAQSRHGVYFIAASDISKSLQKIDERTGASEVVVANFKYESLSKGGNPRWLVSGDYKHRAFAIIDTLQNEISSVGRRDAAAVLSDGRLILAHDGEMMIGNHSCKSGKPRTGKSGTAQEKNGA
jgi:hypothetical protein